MAHLQKQAAIFSPSVARAAASAAKDWNAVDSWLSSRLGGRPPPPFERNPDTLRVLLSLASFNETADEERDLLSRSESDAVTEPGTASESGEETNLQTVREDILDQIAGSLPRDGRVALDALAGTAVELGLAAAPDAASVAARLASLQCEIFDLAQMADRVAVLRGYILAETERVQKAVEEFRSDESYRPAAGLAKENLETQRRVKAALSAVPRAASGPGKKGGMEGVTAEEVRRGEEELMGLLARRNELDGLLRNFQGLPPDVDAARRELETLRDELREVTRRRDEVFEGLVERETPGKPRTRR